MRPHNIFVIGSSMGGVQALKRLASGLPEDWPACGFIVQHTSEHGQGLLAGLLDRSGPVRVVMATDGHALRCGHVYVAPPAKHLLIKNDRMILSSGPRENRTRPAIDPLFRSAAVYHGSRTVGIILTGLLDDGAAGLQAVARCGGKAIVQDPWTAEYREMPMNAMHRSRTEMILPLDKIPGAMGRLAREPAGPSVKPPRDLVLEVKMAEGRASIREVQEWGTQIPLVCPDCGGSMWTRRDGKLRRYRCHVGHAFTPESLADAEADLLEARMWSAIRSLDEQATLAEQMAADFKAEGFKKEAANRKRAAGDARKRARQIEAMLKKSIPKQQFE